MDYKRLTIALDADDTLFDCTSPAIMEANRRYGLDIDPYDVPSWGFTYLPEKERSAIYSIFNDPDFFVHQKPLPGAIELVNTLLEWGHDVIIPSATGGPVMTARFSRIREVFPGIPEDNIILGGRKDVVAADVLLDDGMHNIITTRAKYPVIMRQTWNKSDPRSSAYLSVYTYEEFLAIVEQLSLASTPMSITRAKGPKVICLIGPSGSGKTALAHELEKNPAFQILHSCTTRARRPDDAEDAYHFITRAEFEENRDSFLETTEYAGHYYGTRFSDIEVIWNTGKNAVIPIDITGALAMKKLFAEHAILLFIHRKRHDVICDLITRNAPIEDRTKRILTLEKEYENESACDHTILNNRDLHTAAQQVMQLLE